VTAEIDATKDMQDMYQQMLEDAKRDREDRREQVDELRADRDHYKQERNELRDKMEQLTRSFMDWRIEADNDRSKMRWTLQSWAERWRRWSLLCAATSVASSASASSSRKTGKLKPNAQKGQLRNKRRNPQT
jgi:chromosome segregation ATPase